MSDAGYIFAGYLSTFAVLAGYAAWVLRRKQTLGRLLPPPATPSADSREAMP